MTKKPIFLVLAATIFVVVVLFGIRLFSGEDNWICQDGQWIMHGKPSSPMPSTSCGGAPANANPTQWDKYCERDEDCACGKKKDSGECFYGNSKFVDTTAQCPDFCSGMKGDKTVKCVDHECKIQ